MGVSGAGKTTVGQRLAKRLGWHFLEGDAFHPPVNVERMTAGKALTDADRAPWLDALHTRLVTMSTGGQPVILACSALKEAYRRRLSDGLDEVHFVYLCGSTALLRKRLNDRLGHYMPTSLLHSQLDTLEVPNDALEIDIALSVNEITGLIIENVKMWQRARH